MKPGAARPETVRKGALMQTFVRFSILSSFLIVVVGCTQSTGPSKAASAILLTSEPADSMGVVELKTALTSEQPPEGEASILGRVGGGQNETFDTTQAAFLLRDMSLKIDSHDHGGNQDNCKFCQAEKAKELEAMALVRIVNADGAVIATDARELLGLKENHIVVAQGKGSVDEVGTFVFDASTIFIRP